ncbi:PREDICTED: putative F-box protein At1g50870 [Nicotiana attenuata]|uniref:F-box domain-containing protein n=1 Tax=Nicotiana attenuata TaxID=49451 RepID=A0A314L8Q0_NICAT|nr:PREDICTED: putative F-box protein At1g50870 [Nicotiana attenuata]OIT37477.1 hypothetical protein A4A49_01081 [Nicotiana attenuata]
MMTQKTDICNKSSREAAKIAQKANLFKGQQKKIVCAYFKGKRVMRPLKNTMQMDVDPAMGIHLAEKIIVDILSRLPVRSLLRFKCVSKFWKTLISDPYFKMKHLIHARNNQNSQKLLISQFYLGMDHSFSFYCSSLLVKDVQKLDCPLNIEQVILRIFCCYDGLSIVGVGDCSSEEFKFFLWNPSTRESIELPVPELLPRKGYCTWGLGYDLVMTIRSLRLIRKYTVKF